MVWKSRCAADTTLNLWPTKICAEARAKKLETKGRQKERRGNDVEWGERERNESNATAASGIPLQEKMIHSMCSASRYNLTAALCNIQIIYYLNP